MLRSLILHQRNCSSDLEYINVIYFTGSMALQIDFFTAQQLNSPGSITSAPAALQQRLQQLISKQQAPPAAATQGVLTWPPRHAASLRSPSPSRPWFLLCSEKVSRIAPEESTPEQGMWEIVLYQSIQSGDITGVGMVRPAFTGC